MSILHMALRSTVLTVAHVSNCLVHLYSFGNIVMFVLEILQDCRLQVSRSDFLLTKLRSSITRKRDLTATDSWSGAERGLQQVGCTKTGPLKLKGGQRSQ